MIVEKRGKVIIDEHGKIFVAGWAVSGTAEKPASSTGLERHAIWRAIWALLASRFSIAR